MNRAVVPRCRHDRGIIGPPPQSVGLTAAICTRNRPNLLQRALLSLSEQTLPPNEILVIDNAPSDEAARLLVTGRFSNVRYVREPLPGLDFARNRALRESSQEIVAFLDDDAVAGPDWSRATAAVFAEHRRVAICTGKVEALLLESAGQRLFEDNGGFARGDERIHLPRDGRKRLHGMKAPLIAWSISVGSGCSLAVRRSLILQLGGFDPALDMGVALPGGGDLDIIWRALDAEYEVVYEPKVQARHEHRGEISAAVKQIAEHNRALIAVLAKTVHTTRGLRRMAVIAFLCWRLVKPGARLLLSTAGHDPLSSRALLFLWCSCWRGLGAYPAAKRLARLRASAASL